MQQICEALLLATACRTAIGSIVPRHHPPQNDAGAALIRGIRLAEI
jgi:hypothetical protein